MFIPNSSKQVYNYENIDNNKLIQLAQIHSIKDTWTDSKAVKEAQQRLKEIFQQKPQVKKTHDFEFVIDDEHVYHEADDFRSPQAKTLFEKYFQLEKSYNQQQNKLTDLRNQYIRATKSEKEKMAPAILDLEKRVRQLAVETEQAGVKARNQEKQTFK